MPNKKINFINSRELGQRKDLLLLDIRDKIKFSQNAIKGSINIDVYNDLHEGNFGIVKGKLKILPKNKIIITVCNAGITAQAASTLLSSMGYKTAVLEHGMIGWNAMNRDNKLDNH